MFVTKTSDTFEYNDLSHEKEKPFSRLDNIITYIASSLFLAASYLTDPLSKSHESYKKIHVIDAIESNSYKISNLTKKIFLSTLVFGWGFLALFITFPGITFRWIALNMQKNPFIHIQGNSNAKNLPEDSSFSLLSWNICAIGGGYSISDGGVFPWPFRIDKIVDKIIKKNIDIVCLYEVFDIKCALYICKKLQQKGYKHFYFNIGPKAIGVSSGIFIASKYDIKKPQFIRFPKSSLVGRTKNTAKGVFSFYLTSQKKDSFARIFATHLQHSQLPAFPTQQEIIARIKQMQIIVDKVKQTKQGCCGIVTGDLNLDDNEKQSSYWFQYFKENNDFEEGKTWGGDEFCAKMERKKVSQPLNLDHTLILENTARFLYSKLASTKYNAKYFNEKALSDHKPIISRIGV